MRLGIVGCGRAGVKYLEALQNEESIEFVACADRSRSRARNIGRHYGLKVSDSVEDLLSNSLIDIVLNLTHPCDHVDVGLTSLKAGKHVYSERPIATDRSGAAVLISAATTTKRLLACAPDQLLGPSLQEAANALVEGLIGEPLAATAFMLEPGPEYRNEHIDQYYQAEGGGPFFNRGPYYVGALVKLLGDVDEVAAIGRAASSFREVKFGPGVGTLVPVAVDTHVSASLRFRSGMIATVVTSFDVWQTELPCIEIYGTKGTLHLGDPVSYNAPVRVRLRDGETVELPLSDPFGMGGRVGRGVLELVERVVTGSPHTLTAERAYHLLDVILAVRESSAHGRHMPVASTCETWAPSTPA